MKKIYSLIIALFGVLTTTAQVNLANFDFNGSSSLPSSATTTTTNITASINGTESNAAYSGTASGSGAFAANTTAGNALSMSGNTNTNTWTLTMGGSDLNKYMSYKIYFQSERSSTGATAITVSYSSDGSTYTALSQTVSTGNTVYAESIVDLSSISTINNQTAVYIRFTPSGASASGGTLRLDNLQIQAALSPWTMSGGNVNFTGGITATSFTTTGDARINGNLTAGGLTSNSSSLNVTTPVVISNTLKNTTLAGTGSRLLLTDATGLISPLAAGTSSQVLYGNGAWAALPAATFTASGSNAYFTGGNLGIGTNTPAYPLDVNGNARVSSNLTVSGIATINQLNISQNISSPKLITSRITATDTNGVHIGDSSVVISTVPASGSNFSYDKISSSMNRLAVGFSGVAAYGVNSMAIGMTQTEADGKSSMAIGYEVKTTAAANNAIALGSGLVNSKLINNTPYSLAVGFNSNLPTLFVGGGNGTVNSIGNIGIGTSTPNAMLDITIFGAADGFNINNGINSVFNIKNNGSSFIGGNNNSTYSANKLLTVNGDVSLANYNPAGGTHANDGFSGFEILGNNQIPTRRGISIDTDPNGDVNFFVNGNQASSEFRFKNGAATTNNDLMILDATGSLTIPSIKNTTTSQYSALLVDIYGKLVSGPAVASTSSLAWNVGGNGTNASAVALSIGTTDANDLPIITNNKERMRINGATGNISLFYDYSAKTSTQFLIRSADVNHGLGYFDGAANGNTANWFGSTPIDGPVLYGYSGGALATTYNGAKLVALQWDLNGRVHIGSQKVTSGPHTDALLTVSGKVACQEVRVFTNSSGTYWADYVFNSEYKLLPLKNVEDFYLKNKHLPGVPSAEEINIQGNDLAKTDAILLSKIEENTIYIVDLNKKLEKLAQENEELKTLVKKLLNK